MTFIRRYAINLILDALKERDLQMDQALEDLRGARGQPAANEYDRIIHGRLHGRLHGIHPEADPVGVE